MQAAGAGALPLPRLTPPAPLPLRVCPAVLQAGQGATVLVHEATFEPCLEVQARAKRHSTTAEALEAAQRMGAYRCILTHFSQRYPKWPEGVGTGAADPAQAADPVQAGGQARAQADGGARAAVAFDGMRVPLALLPALPALMPAVRAALADAEEAAEAEQEAGAGGASDDSE